MKTVVLLGGEDGRTRRQGPRGGMEKAVGVLTMLPPFLAKHDGHTKICFVISHRAVHSYSVCFSVYENASQFYIYILFSRLIDSPK